MRKDIGTRTFYDDSLPPWICPTCGLGRLETATTPKKKGTLSIAGADANTTAMWRADRYPFSAGVFARIIRCNRIDCEESVAIVGVYDPLETMIEGQQATVREHTVRYIEPALHFFAIPEKCPPKIRVEVVSAFSLFWCDPKSCLNRVRSAVELLLTRLRVPAMRTLHERIEQLAKTKPELAEHCMAVKWLGNAGSHTAKASDEDAFDGFELLEHILREAFDPLNKLTKNINQRKGPRKRKKK